MDTSSKQKLCKICNENQGLHNFYKDAKSNDGYRNECKSCHNKKKRNKYAIDNKKIDEKMLLKEKFLQQKNEIDDQISLSDDPDKILELREKLDILIDEYVEKIRPETNIFFIDYQDDINFDDQKMTILSKLSLLILQKLKKILNTDLIIINEDEKMNQIRVELPIDYKLKKDIITDFKKSLYV